MKFYRIGKYIMFIQNQKEKSIGNIAQQPKTQQQQ